MYCFYFSFFIFSWKLRTPCTITRKFARCPLLMLLLFSPFFLKSPEAVTCYLNLQTTPSKSFLCQWARTLIQNTRKESAGLLRTNCRLKPGARGRVPHGQRGCTLPLWNPEVHRPRGGKGPQPSPTDITTTDAAFGNIFGTLRSAEMNI